MQIRNYRDKYFSLVLSLSIALSAVSLPQQVCLSAQERTVRTDDPADWKHFQPMTYSKLKSLLPSPTIGGPNLLYNDGVSFPDDPVKGNLVFGRGKNNVPTTVYATGNSPILLGGKVFIAPKAGKSEAVQVNSQQVTIWGTSVYTPLPDLSLAANVAQLIPFDPDHVFYLDRTGWPGYVYEKAGSTLYIAGKQITVPAAGKRQAVTVRDAQGVEHTVTISGIPDNAIQPNFIKHTALPPQLPVPQNVESGKGGSGSSTSASPSNPVSSNRGKGAGGAVAASTSAGTTGATAATPGKGAGGVSGASGSGAGGATSGDFGAGAASASASGIPGKGAGGASNASSGSAGTGASGQASSDSTGSPGNAVTGSSTPHGKGAQTPEFKELTEARRSLTTAGANEYFFSRLTPETLQNNLKHYVSDSSGLVGYFSSFFSISKNQGTKITPEMVESFIRPTVNQLGSIPGLNRDGWQKFLPVLQAAIKTAYYSAKIDIASKQNDLDSMMNHLSAAQKAGVPFQESWLPAFSGMQGNSKITSALEDLAKMYPQSSSQIRMLSDGLIASQYLTDAKKSGDPFNAMVKNINDAIAGRINASPGTLMIYMASLAKDPFYHGQITDFLREIAQSQPQLAKDAQSALRTADSQLERANKNTSGSSTSQSPSSPLPANSTGKGSNPADWRNFEPSAVPELWNRLVPKYDATDRDYMGFDDYVHQASAEVLFPHDPTKNGYIGTVKSIYAHQGTPTKSGYIAPAAGRKNQVFGGYTLYGTTNFTPINYNGSIDEAVDFKRIAAHVYSGSTEIKQDLNRMFFAFNDDMCWKPQDKVWPYIIYLLPGESVKIDNHSQQISCPTAGQPVTINVGGIDNLQTGAVNRMHMIRIMRMPESPIIPGRITP